VEADEITAESQLASLRFVGEAAATAARM
jgi:hypothetical protein